MGAWVVGKICNGRFAALLSSWPLTGAYNCVSCSEGMKCPALSSLAACLKTLARACLFRVGRNQKGLCSYHLPMMFHISTWVTDVAPLGSSALSSKRRWGALAWYSRALDCSRDCGPPRITSGCGQIRATKQLREAPLLVQMSLSAQALRQAKKEWLQRNFRAPGFTTLGWDGEDEDDSSKTSTSPAPPI